MDESTEALKRCGPLGPSTACFAEISKWKPLNSLEFGLGVCISSNEDSVLSLLLLLWFLLAGRYRQGIAVTYCVTMSWRIIFDFTDVILEVGVEFGGPGHWAWRQRLHIEKCISGLSLLEHLDSGINGRHR